MNRFGWALAVESDVDKDKILGRFFEVAADPLGYARQWKESTGRQVIGSFPMNFPGELAHASGALPMMRLNPALNPGTGAGTGRLAQAQPGHATPGTTAGPDPGAGQTTGPPATACTGRTRRLSPAGLPGHRAGRTNRPAARPVELSAP